MYCNHSDIFLFFLSLSFITPLQVTHRTGWRHSYLYGIFKQSFPDIQNPLLCITLLLQCTVKTDIKQGANKCNYGRLVGKRSGKEETGSLTLVWTVWFHYAYASRSEVVEGMPLTLGFLWESLWCSAHKAMFNCSFFLSLFFFKAYLKQIINCITVYSWALLVSPSLRTTPNSFLSNI